MELTNEPQPAVRGYVGPNCRRGRREEVVRGRENISRGPANCAPVRHTLVACHIDKCGKMNEPRNKSGKVVGVTLRVRIGQVTSDIMVKI